MPSDFTELDVYRLAMEVGTSVGSKVRGWSHFDRSVIGIQLARAAHGIAANLAEAAGRAHVKDRRLFIYYARGSARETRCWLDKAQLEGLLSEPDWSQNRDAVMRIEKMLTRLARAQRGEAGRKAKA